MMTKELHLKLEKYESIFRTAIDSNYYRAMDSRFAAEFINACKELNVYINISCPQCVLKALLTVGKLYFNYRAPEKPAKADKAEKSDTVKQSGNKTIKPLNKASQNANKQALKKK